MGRLIDADALIEWINKQREEVTKKQVTGTEGSIFTREDLVAMQRCLSTFETAINNQPTAYDVDKVVAELKKSKVSNVDLYDENNESWNDDIVSFDTAIEIVRKGGVNDMVNEFCGFKYGVIGTDKMPADTTLNNMKKVDLIKLLHTAQHNYETLMFFYNNAVKVNMSQLNNNGWISVKDRLPTEEGSYLVVGKTGGATVTRWYMPNKFHPQGHFGGNSAEYIRYWMPRPQAPKEGE